MKKFSIIIALILKCTIILYAQTDQNLSFIVKDSLSGNQNSYSFHILEIENLINNKNYDSAETILLKPQFKLDDQVKYNFLGMIAYKKNEKLKAKKFWILSTKNNEYLFQSYKNLGMYYSYEGEVDNAINYYEYALSIIGERDIEILLNLAYLYRAKGDYNRALSIWSAIKVLKPTLYVNSEVAYLYHLRGKNKKAIEIFEFLKNKKLLKEWGYILLIQLYENNFITKSISTAKSGLKEYPKSDKITYEYLRILLENRLYKDAKFLINTYSLKNNNNSKIQGLVLDYFIATKNKKMLFNTLDLDSNNFQLDTLITKKFNLSNLDSKSEENLVKFLFSEKKYRKLIKQNKFNHFINNDLIFLLAKSFLAIGNKKKFISTIEKLYEIKENNIDDEFMLVYSFSSAFQKQWGKANSAIKSIPIVDGGTYLRILRKIFKNNDSIMIKKIAPYVILNNTDETGDKKLDQYLKIMQGKILSDTIKFTKKYLNLNVYELIGDNYFRKNNFSEALKYFKKDNYSLKSDKYYQKYKQALCYNRLNDIKNSKRILLELNTKENSEQYLHKLLIGFYFANSGDMKKAIMIWEGLEKYGIKDFNLSRNLALAYDEENEYEKSLSKLKKLFNDNPDSLGLLNDISKIYKKRGNTEQSMAYNSYKKPGLNTINNEKLKKLYKKYLLIKNKTLEQELTIFRYYYNNNQNTNGIKFFETSKYLKKYSLSLKLDYVKMLILNYDLKKAYKYLKKLEPYKNDKVYYLQVVALCQANKEEKSIKIIDKISDKKYKLASKIIYNSVKHNCDEVKNLYLEFVKYKTKIYFFNMMNRCKY